MADPPIGIIKQAATDAHLVEPWLHGRPPHTSEERRSLPRAPSTGCAARVVGRLDQVAEDPFGPHTKPLAGPGGRRSARVDALRIVFTVDRDQHLVDVSYLGPRGQIYRRL